MEASDVNKEMNHILQALSKGVKTLNSLQSLSMVSHSTHVEEVLGSNNELSLDPEQNLQVLHVDPLSLKYALVKEKLLAQPYPTFLLISSARYANGFFDGITEGLSDDMVESESEGVVVPWLEGAFVCSNVESGHPKNIICSLPLPSLKGS